MALAILSANAAPWSGRYPRNHWKGCAGQERARASVAELVKELGLEDVAPGILYSKLTEAELRKRGLHGMLQRVYRGSRRAAINDYLQTTRPKMEGESNPNVATTLCQPQTYRLSLRLLGGVEIAIDGVRIGTLERASRLVSVLCILALHRSGLRSERISALLSGENFPADLRPRQVAPVRGRAGGCATDADVDLSQSPQLAQGQEQGQAQAGTATGATILTTLTKMAVVTHNLRQMVYRIRRAAGWPDIVVSRMERGGGETTYKLPDGMWCDIWEFEAKLTEADWHSTRHWISGAAELASTLREEAIALYGGDLDCELGDGAMIAVIAHEAIRLRERYVGALLDQAVYWQRLALGHWQKSNTKGIEGVNEEDAWRHALRYYMEAVRADRHNELAYVGAMRCHAHLGNWVKVQQVFEICWRVLSSELGKEPSQLTNRAYEEFAMLCCGHIPGLRGQRQQ